MSTENLQDITYLKKESRGKRSKAVFTKVSAILKTSQKNGGIIRFIFSRQGYVMIKKFFKHSFKILFNIQNNTGIIEYALWRKKNMPTEADFDRYRTEVTAFTYQPKISILVPVYNTRVDFLDAMIQSVTDQIYTNWELCLADDNSPSQATKDLLKKHAAENPKIKVVFREKNGHISACTNSALALATGEFCALFDHDDLLTKDALFEVVKFLNAKPEADLIYTNEDKTDGLGAYLEPHFKPSWSPDNLLSRNYIGHLSVLRTSIIKDINGFQEGMEGSQDYDIYLRFTEKTNNIYHIPKVLYHWRMHEDSVALNMHSKPYAYTAAELALAAATERRGEPGTVTMNEGTMGFYTIRYKIKEHKKVSIIIPTKDKSYLLSQCLESIFSKTSYPAFEVIVIDNGSTEKKHQALIEKYQAKYKDQFFCYKLDIPFNFSKLINYGVSKSTGDFLLLLNNDTKVITNDWIEALVEQAQRKSIGAVSPKLLFPDETIQHAGIIFDKNNLPKHILTGKDSYVYDLIHTSINNYPALTAACMMVKRSTFESVGGFDEKFAVEFNDIDFCLKLVQKGLYNVYIPHAQLFHYESVSRGKSDSSQSKFKKFMEEKVLFLSIWENFIKKFKEEHYLCFEETIN